MSIFFEILSAINNPEQKASIDQLSQATNTIQQLAKSNGIDPAMTQSLLSTAGGYLQSALQQQGGTGGAQQISGLLGSLTGGAGGGNPIAGAIGQLTDNNPSLSAIQALIPSQIQQQMIQGLVQKTGLNADVVQGMLPTLLPTVLNLLQMGAGKADTPEAKNPVLEAFLDNSGGNSADLGEVFKFANRFLNPAK
jgi:hypothetical protein